MFYYPITEVRKFSQEVGRGSCYQQFASARPHGDGSNRFVVIFDEDIDTRVLDRLGAVYKICGERDFPYLYIVAERKGLLTLVFKKDHGIAKACQDSSSLETAVKLLASDEDHWSIYCFIEDDDFEEYAGHLTHPKITKEQLDEATTWHV